MSIIFSKKITIKITKKLYQAEGIILMKLIMNFYIFQRNIQITALPASIIK